MRWLTPPHPLPLAPYQSYAHMQNSARSSQDCEGVELRRTDQSRISRMSQSSELFPSRSLTTWCYLVISQTRRGKQEATRQRPAEIKSGLMSRGIFMTFFTFSSRRGHGEGKRDVCVLLYVHLLVDGEPAHFMQLI